MWGRYVAAKETYLVWLICEHILHVVVIVSVGVAPEDLKVT
jgi:hypothetical protein